MKKDDDWPYEDSKTKRRRTLLAEMKLVDQTLEMEVNISRQDNHDTMIRLEDV